MRSKSISFLKYGLVFLLLIGSAALMSGCSSGSNTTTSTATTDNYVGTQLPGDFWNWAVTNTSGSLTFSATDNDTGYTYSGTATPLAGNSAGLNFLNITSSSDPGIANAVAAGNATAYEIEVPDTLLLAATAPFYTFNHSSLVQLSIHAPVVASAQGSCPTSGITNVVWINMPSSQWCPTAISNVPGKDTCDQASNAFGTAVINANGGTYSVTILANAIDGSLAVNQPTLTNCTCASGVLTCTDQSGDTAHIAFLPSGIFIFDSTKNQNSIAGVVQPSSNIDLNDFLASGNTFKGMHFDSWESYYNPTGGCGTDANCVGLDGIPQGQCLKGYCGVPNTSPISVIANGTGLMASQYQDIYNGVLSSSGGTIDFTGATQPYPGLITATLMDACGNTDPIVMAITQVNGKYVAFALTHSTCPGFDTASSVLVIQQ